MEDELLRTRTRSPRDVHVYVYIRSRCRRSEWRMSSFACCRRTLPACAHAHGHVHVRMHMHMRAAGGRCPPLCMHAHMHVCVAFACLCASVCVYAHASTQKCVRFFTCAATLKPNTSAPAPQPQPQARTRYVVLIVLNVVAFYCFMTSYLFLRISYLRARSYH